MTSTRGVQYLMWMGQLFEEEEKKKKKQLNFHDFKT